MKSRIGYLVYGDTNSTLAGALAASKLHIKLAHVEAGLRSFNRKMPEEINRILTDRIADVLFCPTEQVVMNLKEEGFGAFDAAVVKSGDVMQDAALFYADKKTTLLPFDVGNDFVLVTIHRAENTDDPLRLKAIVDALHEIARERQLVLPMHPRTKQLMNKYGVQLNSRSILCLTYPEWRVSLIQSDS